jgi:hypothetical protein
MENNSVHVFSLRTKTADAAFDVRLSPGRQISSFPEWFVRRLISPNPLNSRR